MQPRSAQELARAIVANAKRIKCLMFRAFIGNIHSNVSSNTADANQLLKRTGSLTVLQQAMGHASLAVSLGYLRNLEVPMLKVEDMPKFDL